MTRAKRKLGDVTDLKPSKKNVVGANAKARSPSGIPLVVSFAYSFSAGAKNETAAVRNALSSPTTALHSDPPKTD
jgi:hypothetical protein